MDDSDCDCGGAGVDCCACCPDELPSCCPENCSCCSCCPEEFPSCCPENCSCSTCCYCLDTEPTASNQNSYLIICIDTPSCDPCCWSYNDRKNKARNATSNVSAFRSNNPRTTVPPVAKNNGSPESQVNMERDDKHKNPGNSLTLT